MSLTVMMFSPYVIDVPLSVGGLLANHAEAGDKVFVVSMCYPGKPSWTVFPEVVKPGANIYGRFKTKGRFEREVARKEAQGVAKALGIEPIITWDYDGNSDALFGMDVVDRTVEVLNKHKPDIAVAFWPISNYSDFTGTTSALLRALQERHLDKIPQVYFGETLTGKHTLCFTPNFYVDTTGVMKKKKKASAVVWQGKNLEYFFNTHSLPIARFRGRECGTDYAEAYVALHGGFGLEKRFNGERTKPHPMTMQPAAKRLQLWQSAEGILPNNGSLDNETAHKVFGV